MAYLLHQLLEESALRHPDRPAVIFGDRTLTYCELDRASDQFAHLLLDVGVARGGMVGVHLHRGADALIAIHGALKIGAIYVPLDPQSPSARLRYIVDTCRLQVVATAREHLATLDDALKGAISVGRVVLMDGGNPGQRPLEAPAIVDWVADCAADLLELPEAATIDLDSAYVLFTSGSTGAPKGVVISHRNALTFVNAAGDLFDITADDRLSHVCPLLSDMSVFDIYVALRAGACIVGIPEVAAMFPPMLARAIREYGITVWNSVPSALVGVARLDNLDLASLRLVLFAGEAFPVEPLRRLMAAVPEARFCNMYGQTEANTSTYHWVGGIPEGSREPVPIGRALPNFEVFALGDDGHQAVGPGEEGELYVRSSTVALGYWGDPDRSARAFIANPLDPSTGGRVYRTGDIVRLDAKGDLVFLGRKDLMTKSRGYRVEIEEVEGALRNHPGITNAAVIAVPDERIGNRLAAFVEPRLPGGLTRDEVMAHCLSELPRYMIPEDITFCDALPLTPLGKVDRQRLARP